MAKLLSDEFVSFGLPAELPEAFSDNPMRTRIAQALQLPDYMLLGLQPGDVLKRACPECGSFDLDGEMIASDGPAILQCLECGYEGTGRIALYSRNGRLFSLRPASE